MSNRCGTCGQPRNAWETIEAVVAALRERGAKAKRRAPTGALKFMLRLAAEGGRIVSTASLTPEQVIEARESQRLFVTGEGLGFVIFPAGVTAAHPFTAKQKGLVAGDGQPCPNDHDPDCRYPDCNCRRPWALGVNVGQGGNDAR